MLQYLFQSFFIAAEKPKLGLFFTVAAGATNMVLDFVLVGVAGFGLAGAASATVISQMVGGVAPIFLLCEAPSRLPPVFHKAAVQPAGAVQSLHQRQRTLYKVVESIVKHQRGFFEEGISKFKPLILKDIADDINMHESTVSRITTNKYVATPFGVYELKFFFNSALELDDGSQVGSESVKALIKKCISEEDPKNPLSDETHR